MGRKPKLQSNPKFAHPHEKGAPFFVMQDLTHKTLGAISYPRHEIWPVQHDLSVEAYKRLKIIHEQILAIEPGKTNIRQIMDMEFLSNIYEAGSEMVSRSIRAVQYLAEAMERISGEPLRENTTEGRIKEAVGRLGLNSFSNTDEYRGL